nr:PREDICTED: protein TIC 22, chloroplastic-like [Musa acuminata subsp. malaccensis]
MTLDQVYMLKVEGIGFRFLPDPLQIKKCSSIKSANVSRSFDGVPVFQSDFLVKEKNKQYCPHILPEGRYRKRASQGFQGIKWIRIFSRYYGMILLLMF